MPSNHGERTVNLISLFWMGFHVLFNLFASQVLRVKSSPGWNGSGANEGFVVVEQIEARSIDPEIAPQHFILWILARSQRLIQRQPIRINLPPVDLLEIARSVHQFPYQLYLASTQAGRVKWYLYPAKLGEASSQVRNYLHPRRLG